MKKKHKKTLCCFLKTLAGRTAMGNSDCLIPINGNVARTLTDWRTLWNWNLDREHCTVHMNLHNCMDML